MDENSFSFPSAKDLLNTFKDVANTVLDIQGTRYALANQADTQAFNRQMNQLQLSTAATIAGTQARTAETQAQVALVRAQQPLMQGWNGVMPSGSGDSGLMVFLTIIGVGVGIFALMKGAK